MYLQRILNNITVVGTDYTNWKNSFSVLVSYSTELLNIKGALSGPRQLFLITESHLKIMKNAFYFTSEDPFVLKIFKFLS